MKKALMYLLLALGIILVVALIGGALIGFTAGFINGFNESSPGTTDTKYMIVSSGMLLVLLVCLVLNYVFLHFGYAKYSVGHIPKAVRWKVVVALVFTMAGMALVYGLMYNPLYDSDETISASYRWIRENPLISLPYLILIEATGDLILFGGVLREILEWKHRPAIVVIVFAVILSFVSGVSTNFSIIIPAYMMAMIEAWVYEYSRSVIPVIIADSVFWIVMIFIIGFTLPWWCFFVAGAMIIPGAYFALSAMEPYKPID